MVDDLNRNESKGEDGRSVCDTGTENSGSRISVFGINEVLYDSRKEYGYQVQLTPLFCVLRILTQTFVDGKNTVIILMLRPTTRPRKQHRPRLLQYLYAMAFY